jgi:hypothetical protein
VVQVNGKVRARNAGEYCTTTGAMATVRLWALAGELNGIAPANLAVFRYEGDPSAWTSLTGWTTGDDGGSYYYAEGQTPSFSHFLLGATGSSPTAVSLRQVGSTHSRWASLAAGLGVALCTAALGVAAAHRRRRA